MRSPKIICLKIQTKKHNVLKLYKGKNSFSNTHLMRIFFCPVSFQKSLLPNSLEKCSVTFFRNSPTRKLFLWCSRIFRSVRDIDHSPFTYKASRGELLNDKTKTAIQTVYEIQVVVGIPLLKHLLSEKKWKQFTINVKRNLMLFVVILKINVSSFVSAVLKSQA